MCSFFDIFFPEIMVPYFPLQRCRRQIFCHLFALWGLSDILPLPEGRRHLWHMDFSTSCQNVNTAFTSSFLLNPNAGDHTISLSPSLFLIISMLNFIALRHIWFYATAPTGGRETFRTHVVFTQYYFSHPLPCSCSGILVALFEAYLIFSLYLRGAICDTWTVVPPVIIWTLHLLPHFSSA